MENLESTKSEGLAPQEAVDPVVVFLAGAFVGLVLGPQVLRVGRELAETKGRELATAALDRFVETLKTDITSGRGM